MQRLKIVLPVIIIALLASACGQKGPLYLPEREQAPTQTRDGPAGEQKEEEDSGADEEKA